MRETPKGHRKLAGVGYTHYTKADLVTVFTIYCGCLVLLSAFGNKIGMFSHSLPSFPKTVLA